MELRASFRWIRCREEKRGRERDSICGYYFRAERPEATRGAVVCTYYNQKLQWFTRIGVSPGSLFLLLMTRSVY